MSPTWDTKNGWLVSEEQGDSANIIVQECGKVICLTLIGKSKSRTEDDLVLTIPTDYRPLCDTYFLARCGDKMLAMRIWTSNGKMTVFSGSASTAARLYFCVTYIRA